MILCPRRTHPYKVKAGDSLWLIAQQNQLNLQEIEAANPDIDMNNLYIGQIICVPERYRSNQMYEQPKFIEMSPTEELLSNYMRLLWEQHVYWTRLVIISMVFDLPDVELVTNRLLRNPQDFEAALSSFYGENNAARFAELLTNHLIIAGELIQAAKEKNNAAVIDARSRWYDNADEIAIFLNNINPYWTLTKWQGLLYDHLAMTEEEVQHFLSKNYEESIFVFENIEQEALEMADTMTQGIVRQFPQYFR